MAYYMHNLIIPNAFAQNCHLRGIFQQAKRDNPEGKKDNRLYFGATLPKFEYMIGKGFRFPTDKTNI